jgi:hypothetical protein
MTATQAPSVDRGTDRGGPRHWLLTGRPGNVKVTVDLTK